MMIFLERNDEKDKRPLEIEISREFDVFYFSCKICNTIFDKVDLLDINKDGDYKFSGKIQSCYMCGELYKYPDNLKKFINMDFGD